MKAHSSETTRLGADSLRGIVMRAPGVAATRSFYVDNWGLSIAAEQDTTVYYLSLIHI